LAIHPAALADVVFVLGERALRPLAARAWRQLMQAASQRVRPLAGARSHVASGAVANASGDLVK